MRAAGASPSHVCQVPHYDADRFSALLRQVRGGYATVSWLCGGFDSAAAGDFDTSNGKDMRYGAVGGLSGALGLSDVQREEAARRAGVPGWVCAWPPVGCLVCLQGLTSLLHHQVAPALAFALVNGISVTWLMQFKPAGAP